MKNLAEGLQKELTRNRELLQMYRDIPTGGFGAMMIQNDITGAEEAIKAGDVVKMLTAYKKLEASE